MTRLVSSVVVLLAVTLDARAQDTITFFDRTTSGSRPIQTLKATVEAESLAGIRVAGRFILSVDIVNVAYEPPGLVRLDLPNAVNAEAAGRYDDAIREYSLILGRSAVANAPKLNRQLSYRVAVLTAAKNNGSPEQIKAAINTLTKFIADNPDSWQRVAATRQLAWLYAEADSTRTDEIRKLYEELASVSTAPGELKAECALAIADLHFRAREFEKARKAVSSIAANDPRVALYQIACQIDPAKPEPTIKALEDALAKADDITKATAYNLIGDCYRLDPKRNKDALFSYLWVDVVYNHDPVENAKSQRNLAELFRDMKDENRAKTYRDKLRGR